MARKLGIYGGVIAAGVAVTIVGGLSIKHNLDESSRRHREAAALAYQQEQDRLERERIEAAWQGRLDKARSLMPSAKVDGGYIQCDLPPRVSPKRTSNDAAADRLLAVSEQKLIVFIVPGFEYQTNDGFMSFDNIRYKFANIIAVANEAEPSKAVCMVSWATQYGFGDDTPYLTNAISAVKSLSEDPLIAGEGRARIVVLGYSAGGNFAKNALVNLPAGSSNGPTEIRFLSVLTPHHGSEIPGLAMTGAKTVAIAQKLHAMWTNDSEEDAEANRGAELIRNFESRRGLQQLMPGNAEVIALNDKFERYRSQITFLDIYLPDDTVVPVESARWPGAIEVPLLGYTHTSIITAPAASPWRKVLTTAFGDGAVTSSAVEQDLTPATYAAASY